MIAFRDATEADLAVVVSLLADDAMGRVREDAGPPLPDAYGAGFRAMVAQGGRIILMVDGLDVVACAQLHILHGLSTKGMPRAQVEAVRVVGTRRGEGLGGLLLRQVIAEAQAAGCGVVQLTTHRSRMDAQRFYRVLGFVESHAGMKLAL